MKEGRDYRGVGGIDSVSPKEGNVRHKGTLDERERLWKEQEQWVLRVEGQ